MAEMFQPIVNAVRPFIPDVSPIVDKTMGMVGQAITTIGGGLYTGKQQAGLETEYEQIFTDFFMPEGAKGVAADVASAGAVVDRLEGDNRTSTMDLRIADGILGKNLQRLYEERRQRGGSVEALELKILAATRAAVNRNPMLERELLHTANKYLELSGARDWMSAQKKANEAAAASNEWWMKEAVKLGISPNDPNFKEEVILHNRAMKEYDLGEKQAKLDERKQKAYFNDPRIFDSLTQGAQSNLIARFSVIENNTQLDAQGKISAIERVMMEEVPRYKAVFGENSNSPQVSSAADSMNKMRDVYIKKLSGETSKELAEAQVATVRAAAYLKLNAADIEAVTNIISKLDPTAQIEFTKMPEYQSMVGRIAAMVKGQGLPSELLKAPALVDSAFSSAAEATKKDPNDVEATVGLFNSFFTTMADEKQSSVDKTKWADRFVVNLAKSGPTYGNVPPDMRVRAVGQIRNYLEGATDYLLNAKRYPNGDPLVLPNDTEIKAYKDGTLYFSSLTDPSSASRMNSEFANRFNNSVKAIAHLQGSNNYMDALGTTEVVGVIQSMLNFKAPEPKVEDKGSGKIVPMKGNWDQVNKEVKAKEDSEVVQPQRRKDDFSNVSSGSSTRTKQKETPTAAKVREFLNVPPPKDVTPVAKPNLTMSVEDAAKAAKALTDYNVLTKGKWYLYGDSFDGAILTDGKKFIRVSDKQTLEFKKMVGRSPLAFPKWGE